MVKFSKNRTKNNPCLYIAAFAIALITSSLYIPHAIAFQSNIPPIAACLHTPLNSGPTPGFRKFENASINFINPSRTVLQVKCSGPELKDLVAKDEKLISRLAAFSTGDLVNLTYNPENELSSIAIVDIRVPLQDRWKALSYTALCLFSFTAVALWLAKGNILAIRELFVGLDRRLSNSKSQAALWFFVLLCSYLCITYLRIQIGGFGFVGGISIPQNLLLLSGFSAFTYAGAKALTQNQVNNKPGSKTTALAGTASPADYVTDDEGNTDFGDFQMSVITLLAVGVYLVQIIHYVGIIHLSKSVEMPDLDTTILSLFGLSQGAYLAKKAASASGSATAEPIKEGMKDSKVRDIKKWLNAKLLLSGSAVLDVNSDEFDIATKTKVADFQTQKGLPSTGIVDAATLNKLME